MWRIRQNWKHNLIFILILIILFLRPLNVLYRHREGFFARGYENRYEKFKSAYYSSQYVQKQNPGIIPDNILESFAGGAFLKGLNPILIVHDQPPLGRYFIALSILLFDNAATIQIILYLFSILGIYLIGRTILENKFLALIPLGIMLNEPLYLGLLTSGPLLEPIQLPFIIFAIYFFIKGTQEKQTVIGWWLLVSLMLGFVISIRYFVLGAILLLSFIIYFLVKKIFDQRFAFFVFCLPLSLVILLVSYAQTVRMGYSLIKVLGIQKYIFVYHQSAFVLPFSFWDLLLFNRWHTWWDTYAIAHDLNWTPVWPVATVIVVVFVICCLLRKVKISSVELIILLWMTSYSVMLSTGYTSTRYFLPLLPFLYLLALSFGIKLINKN